MFQGKIEIENGSIKGLVPKSSRLIIEIDNEIFDLGNSFAYPGFVDSHLHLLSGGEFLSMPELSSAKSDIECIEMVLKNKYKRGNWVFARGWNQENWFKKEFPDKELLDKFFPDEPVCFFRADGHCFWVNTFALKMCRIDDYTVSPPGGEILKNSNGSLKGILIDNATNLVKRHFPKYTKKEVWSLLSKCFSHLAQYGITAVHEIELDPLYLEDFCSYFSSSNLSLATKFFLSGLNIEEFEEVISKNEVKELVGIKLYMDGALGSYGALLVEPYEDKQTHLGLQLLSEKELAEKIKYASEHNLGVAIHSIGDKSTNIILNVYKNYLNEGNSSPPFFRIEHSQVVNFDDLELYKELNVVASVQPIHFLSDYYMARNRLGNRTIRAYLWKSFLGRGVTLISGSDFPIENPNPLRGIDAFVNRAKYDTNKYYSNEALRIGEAISSYNYYPCLSINESPHKLEPGCIANITVLDRDLFSISPAEILETNVIATVSLGKIVFSAI
ncbi:MAG: amidohydrolase family protein [Ignavibacteria bacterium]|nr:amidohydrolase family protein [Ignavibacteria bacterium]